MNVKQEIQQLKDEEKNIDYPTMISKGKSNIKFSFELWPLIPVLIIIGIANVILSATETSSFWNYWWLIFLIKPFFFGWGKLKKNRSGICLKAAA